MYDYPVLSRFPPKFTGCMNEHCDGDDPNTNQCQWGTPHVSTDTSEMPSILVSYTVGDLRVKRVHHQPDSTTFVVE